MQSTKSSILLGTVAALAVAASAAAQSGGPFTLDWSTTDGGGGSSTGGVYVVSGTIGQPDAGSATGGNYTLVGGFWSVIQQNLPPLDIELRAGNLVLSWPASDTAVVVQSATQLSSGGAGWSNFAAEPTRIGDRFELIIGPALTPPNPIRFFRLFRQ